MRFYEVYHGEALQATRLVHDDGRQEWERIRHAWPGAEDLKAAIERAAEADPQVERWTYQTRTTRQNQSR